MNINRFDFLFFTFPLIDDQYDDKLFTNYFNDCNEVMIEFV